RMIQKISGSNKRHTLAPGFYAIGDPQRIEMGEKMLNAQAAAITSVSGEQVGTVIVMRDMTEMVRQEQRRERLLQAVEEQVQAPLQDIARASAYDDTPLDDFTREITKRAVALQKLVVEMREITTVDVDEIQQVQKQIRLDTFIWAVANEWRQIAQAAGLQFYVSIERNGMHVLGEERRLRWAVGNIIDNAIKYTPPGGSVTLEVTGESKGQALMRVRDNGAGIAAAELPHVTTRFYRGNPVTKTGAIIRTPGMGQGLHTAEQIFKAHGGFLRVRSKPSIGTAVYFSLPVTSAQSLDLPRLQEDFEGETVKLPENQFPDLRL
ncbi:MAG: HAMP domain-containing sensor histidine kinase, partial [Chloroflexota bacterium]